MKKEVNDFQYTFYKEDRTLYIYKLGGMINEDLCDRAKYDCARYKPNQAVCRCT